MLFNAERFQPSPNHSKLLEYGIKSRTPDSDSFSRRAHSLALAHQSLRLAAVSSVETYADYPLQPLPPANAAGLLSLLGQHEEALELVDEALSLEPTVRASFFLYNTPEEVDAVAAVVSDLASTC